MNKISGGGPRAALQAAEARKNVSHRPRNGSLIARSAPARKAAAPAAPKPVAPLGAPDAECWLEMRRNLATGQWQYWQFFKHDVPEPPTLEFECESRDEALVEAVEDADSGDLPLFDEHGILIRRPRGRR